MIWLLERDGEVVTCEIRRDEAAISSPRQYVFEISSASGSSEVLRFRSASDLIRVFLQRQDAFLAQGWRARVAMPEPARLSLPKAAEQPTPGEPAAVP